MTRDGIDRVVDRLEQAGGLPPESLRVDYARGEVLVPVELLDRLLPF